VHTLFRISVTLGSTTQKYFRVKTTVSGDANANPARDFRKCLLTSHVDKCSLI